MELKNNMAITDTGEMVYIRRYNPCTFHFAIDIHMSVFNIWCISSVGCESILVVIE